MSKKSFLNLLVLIGVLCHGIIGTLSEKGIDESSDLLIRQKRVINRVPTGDIRQPIKHSPYVVSIKLVRFHSSCVGAILTQHIALTVANCVRSEITAYRVYSGSARLSSNSHAKAHDIINKKINYGNHPFRPTDGIALITVAPPFSYSINTRNIGFYEGPVHPGLQVFVSGWGCNPNGPPGTAHGDWLRAISVPVISNDDCNILYLEHFTVSDSDICTLDAFENVYCGASDAGAPLVVKVGTVNYLLGLHLWNGRIVGRSNPDVFVNLQHPNYKTWIQENM